jgi:hypothetical protein
MATAESRAQMSAAQIRERERARALPTSVATFLALALFIAASGLGAVSATLLNPDLIDSETLRSFDEDRNDLLIGTIMQSAALLLLAMPLFYLFQAASARSETMRHALIGITVAGPLFLAASGIVAWVALDQAASDFATPGGGLGRPVGEYVDDLVQDQAAYGAAQGLGFAGTFGLVVGMVYTSLHAMRVGLLTRFWGSLGMALGVSILFLGVIGLLVFFLAIGLLIAGLWPRGRPLAWEEGEAVPWPAPGQEESDPERDDPDRPAEPDEFAATIEGSGTEVGEGEGETAQSPRKRKRRG